MWIAANRVLFLSLASALLADQLLKGFILARLRPSDVVTLGSVRIRQVRSDRVIAGRLGIRPVLLWCGWSGSLLIGLLVAPRVGLFETPLSHAALGLALGGALGNLLDMIFRKAVVDYVEVGGWPAFNLADAAIVIGVIVALLAG